MVDAPRLRRRAIVMVWDGLRPDFVTAETTPRLHALAADGVRFPDSHAVFPTVTRCNSASIATGALPRSHGMPDNNFVLPGDREALTSADFAHLARVRAHRGGRLLLRPTLAEAVLAAGGTAAIVGTGSPGSSFLQHPEVERAGGVIYNQALWAGTTREAMEAALGSMPEGDLPNTAQNAYFTRLITDVLLPAGTDLVTYWHTDPDRTEHRHGVGHPETLRAVRDADDHLGAILDALDRAGLRDTTDVVVTSDHGFSTMGPPVDVTDALVAAGVKTSPESTDVIAAGGSGLYVREGGADRVARVVEVLTGLDGVGCIFTGPRGERPLPGTLAMSEVGHGGDLEPDVLFSLAWSDEANEHGYPGTRRSAGGASRANHGALSPWEVRNTLIAAGPDFRRGLVDPLPAGNTDITPTLLHAMGLRPAAPLDGRVLVEALRDGPEAAGVAVERRTLTSHVGAFRQEVRTARVGASWYVDAGESERG